MKVNLKSVDRPQTPVKEAADGIARADVKAVNATAVRTLYKAREPIHPKQVKGPFRTAKWAMLSAALAVYYILPWVRWPRSAGEPDQAVLADFANGRFYFFWIEIWPQEVYYITGLLILAAMGLFLATALLGRVWCGYACPQTVWTDLYIAVERWIEGDRSARIRLDKSPWGPEKIAKKLSKHAAWIAIAAMTGGAFIFYWHDAPSTFVGLFTGEAPASAYGFLALLTATTYALAGFAREQVCIYMCPWPRIQAAMIDEHSLQVTYRYDRGDPRGPHKKGETWEGRGDCIDCNQCVAACPMGIDIRDGAQLECINCALCIDACDEVMVKIGRPKGLIAYDTDEAMACRVAKKKPFYQFIRTRTVLYASVMAIVGLIMMAGLITRTDVELNVQHDRQPPYVMLSDGSIRNAYTVKIINRANVEREFEIELDAPMALALRLAEAKEGDTALRVRVDPDQVRAVRLFATAETATDLASSTRITLLVRDTATGTTATSSQTFLTDKD